MRQFLHHREEWHRVPTTPLREALLFAEAEITAGKPGEALRRCEALLATHPRWLDAQRVQARAFVVLDRFADAAQILDRILASNPEDAQAFVDRAFLLQRRNDPLGALACYRRACELTAENGRLRATHNQMATQLGRQPYTPSHTGLARLYLRADLLYHALREWDIALQANPARIDAQIGMAETLWLLGQHQRAQETCRFILHSMPNCLKPLLLLMWYELQAGRRIEAQRLMHLAAELDPELRVAGTLFGDLVAMGNAELAEMLRAAARAQTSPLTGAASTSGNLSSSHPSQPSRPFSAPLPTGQLPTGPLFVRPAVVSDPIPTAKLPSMDDLASTEDPDVVERLFGSSQVTDLTAETRALRESTGMIWGEGADPSTLEIQAMQREAMHREAMRREQAQGAAPSAHTDETGFVERLRAMGAQPLPGDAPVPTRDAPAPADVPDTPAAAPDDRVQLPPFLRQAMGLDGTAAIGSNGSEEPHSPQDLAPEPETSIIPSQSSAAQAPVEAPPEIFAESRPGARGAMGTPPPEAMTTPEPTASPAPPPATAPATMDGDPPLTIEAIQEQMESAGFARLETGRLAAVASSLAPAAPEHAPAADAAKQLERARSMRREGRLAEALVEYRALVKAASDRLPEIIRDLRDVAIEHPREAEVHRLLGDAYIRQGDYLEALEAYNRASALRHEVGQ
jgi:tetratricopeptide (TPR) repeat protein